MNKRGKLFAKMVMQRAKDVDSNPSLNPSVVSVKNRFCDAIKECRESNSFGTPTLDALLDMLYTAIPLPRTDTDIGFISTNDTMLGAILAYDEFGNELAIKSLLTDHMLLINRKQLAVDLIACGLRLSKYVKYLFTSLPYDIAAYGIIKDDTDLFHNCSIPPIVENGLVSLIVVLNRRKIAREIFFRKDSSSGAIFLYTLEEVAETYECNWEATINSLRKHLPTHEYFVGVQAKEESVDTVQGNGPVVFLETPWVGPAAPLINVRANTARNNIRKLRKGWNKKQWQRN